MAERSILKVLYANIAESENESGTVRNDQRSEDVLPTDFGRELAAITANKYRAVIESVLQKHNIDKARLNPRRIKA